MLKNRIVTASIAIGLMGLARLATAQNNSDQFRPFGGFFADLLDDGSTPPKPKQVSPPGPSNGYNAAATAQLQRTPTRAPLPQPASQPDPGLPIGPPPSSVDNYTPALSAPPATSST